MTYDIEWVRGDTKPLAMTVTLDGSPMDLSGYTKISICVTSIAEPPDATTLVFKQDGVINPDQVTYTGKITFDMTSHADKTVNTLYYFDIQGIIGGKTDTLKRTGTMIYLQDKNKDTN